MMTVSETETTPKPYTFRGVELPERMREAIDKYVEHGTCGDFLRAVFEDRLQRAFRRADKDNLIAMTAIVAYVFNEIPGDAWGSPEIVDAWSRRRLAERFPEERT